MRKDRQGQKRVRNVIPDGENLCEPMKISVRYPGHIVHLEVKEVEELPYGGRWPAHGRGSQQALASKPAPKRRGLTILTSTRWRAVSLN